MSAAIERRANCCTGQRPQGAGRSRRGGSLTRVEEHVRQKFSTIYESNEWGFGSGVGSLPDNNTKYIEYVQSFIKSNRMKSVVDFGCGDWKFSQYINWQGATYVGVDLVVGVIERNRKQFACPGVTFEVFEVIDNLPEADLLLCKDVFQHLPNDLARDYLSAFKRKFRFLLITNDDQPESMANQDIQAGGWRPLRLDRPPFSEAAIIVLSWWMTAGGWKPTHKATFRIDAGEARDLLLNGVALDNAPEDHTAATRANRVEEHVAQQINNLPKTDLSHYTEHPIGPLGIRIVASMTTIPSRIDTIRPVIEAVLGQTTAVDHLELNIPYRSIRAGVEYVIPPWLAALDRVKVFRTDDYGPITKIAPSLVRHKDDSETYLWSVDDDCAYPPNQLEVLCRAHRPSERCILVRYGGELKSDGTVQFWHGEADVTMFEGFGGVLYPPGCIGDDFAEYVETTSKNELCRRNDDIVLSMYFTARRVRIRLYNVPSEETPYMVSGWLPHAQLDALSANGHKENYKSIFQFIKSLQTGHPSQDGP